MHQGHDSPDRDSTRSIAGGIFAGAVGGVVAGFVKLGWEVPFPPRPPGREPEPNVLVENVTHEEAPTWATPAIHFLFSTLSGALYGAMVEVAPMSALGLGTAYGIAVWIGAHELVMPAAKLTPPVRDLTLQEQSSEFFGHAAWGMSLEFVRSDVRRRLAA